MGPVSMIISGYDKRIIVLRNGVEIGRSTITLKDPETPLGTHAFVMAEGKAAVTPPGWRFAVAKLDRCGHYRSYG